MKVKGFVSWRRRARGSEEVRRIESESLEDMVASRGGSLLRKTAVPPGETLQGEVYFPFPAPAAAGRGSRGGDAYACDVTLHLPTPDGPKRILLRPCRRRRRGA